MNNHRLLEAAEYFDRAIEIIDQGSILLEDEKCEIRYRGIARDVYNATSSLESAACKAANLAARMKRKRAVAKKKAR